MDLLSIVATALLMRLEAEETQETEASNASYPHRLTYSTSECSVVDKENVSPIRAEHVPYNQDVKSPSVPAAPNFQTNTPSSLSPCGSESSHVAEYNDFSAREVKDITTDAVHVDLTADSFDQKRPYWMQKDWIPTNTVMNQKGKMVVVQKSPDEIRQELLRYLQLKKKTKTALLCDFGVNSNSLRKFMDASNYKDPWRAGTSSTKELVVASWQLALTLIHFTNLYFCDSREWNLLGRSTLFGS